MTEIVGNIEYFCRLCVFIKGPIYIFIHEIYVYKSSWVVLSLLDLLMGERSEPTFF